MGFADKLKDLGDKAKLAAAEHKDQITQAVQTAGTVADQRTAGKYRDKISKATQRAEEAVGRLTGDVEPRGPEPTSAAPLAPSEPAGQHAPDEPGRPPTPSSPTLT